MSLRAEVELLRRESQKMTAENRHLKAQIAAMKLQQQKSTTAKVPVGQSANEALLLRATIPQEKAILSPHDELLELRQRCAVYKEALESTAANLSQMKILYAELSKLSSSPTVKGK